MQRIAQPVLCIFCLMLVCAAVPGFARAQASAPSEQALDQDSPQGAQPDQTGRPSGAPTPPDSSGGASSNSDPLTLFPHSDASRYWVSGQANVVFAVASSVPGEIQRAEQPAARRRKRDFESLYALPRLRTHAHHRSLSRYGKRRRPRHQQCPRPRRHHESRRGAKHDAQPGAVCGADHAASDNPAQRRANRSRAR